MTEDLWEIRDYHFAGDMDRYHAWWAEAMPLLRRRGFDVLDLWCESEIDARISGADPMALPHGSANVTWIIRWSDFEQREVAWDALWLDDEWNACADRHPGFDRYLHMSIRFMKSSELL